MYIEKAEILLKWGGKGGKGGKRSGAGDRSSFWPVEIDISHHLNQDQYLPKTLQSSSRFGRRYAM